MCIFSFYFLIILKNVYMKVNTKMNLPGMKHIYKDYHVSMNLKRIQFIVRYTSSYGHGGNAAIYNCNICQ